MEGEAEGFGEVLGEVPTQFRLSCEEKGKMPIWFGTTTNISREAKSISPSSPNLEALAPGTNPTPTSEVADHVAIRVLVPKGTTKVPSHEAGTEALCSAKYLRSKEKRKAP